MHEIRVMANNNAIGMNLTYKSWETLNLLT
jgi:hypothetical protein